MNAVLRSLKFLIFLRDEIVKIAAGNINFVLQFFNMLDFLLLENLVMNISSIWYIFLRFYLCQECLKEISKCRYLCSCRRLRSA